ncbi:MAG: ABC transporter ATP-binding protein [bacterium]|nr:ABC transporter ATP-binding protein [bacterium]
MSALEIRSLHKRYGRLRVVEDLSLRVGRGEIYGLLGPNGSGKTTTLSCALGLLRPTSGQIDVLGEPVRHLARTQGRVGAVFDRPSHVAGMTVKQNMAYAARLRGFDPRHRAGRSAAEALERLGIADLRRRRAGKLSLGQAKRLAIAAALAGDPELLVLDEPLSGLDTLGVRSMLALVRELAGEGLTVVLSSHRLHEMEQVVTHAGVLLSGRIVREGSLDELLAARRGRYTITIDDGPRARAAIEHMPGVEVLGSATSPEGERIDARFTDIGAAAVNRVLVESGCAVSALEPVTSSLQAVFEELADADSASGSEGRVA